MIYWTKKKDTKKNSLQEISRDFIKNDFELMISIYIFTKKESIYFLYFICIQFSKRLFLLVFN